MPSPERDAPAPTSPGAFADAALEAEFRLDHLAQDRRLAATLIGIATAITAALAVVDLAAVAARPELAWLLPVRGAAVLLGIGAAWAASRARRPAHLDALTFAWAIVLAALALAVGPTRPRSYTVNFAFEAIIVMANWALLPNTLPRQALAGLLHTGSSLATALLWRDLAAPIGPALGLALLSANLVGWFTSSRLHLARRAAFLERRRLGVALAEVRTLKGLIPICAGCKSIRTEKGEWRRLEEYLSAHTDALLTHGLCEPCARRLYPDEGPPGGGSSAATG